MEQNDPFYGILFVLANFLLDLFYAYIDCFYIDDGTFSTML